MVSRTIDLVGFDFGSNLTEVRELSNLGVPIAGEIDVTDKFFLLLEPIVCPHTLVGDNFGLYDPTSGKNSITFTGATALKSTIAAGIRIRECTLLGNNTNTFLDVTSVGSGNELISISYSRIGNIGVAFASLGTITNVTTVIHQVTVVGFATGLTHIGGGFSFLSAISFFVFGNTAIQTLSGTFSRACTMQDIDSQFFAGGGFVLNIDSGITFQGARITDVSDSGTTSFFDPTGLDQTDPRVLAVGTDASNSFYTGQMSFNGNATLTTIAAINTFADIGGTSVASSLNERFTHSTSPNELTYIGVETVKVVMHFNISATKTGGAKIFGFALFIDTGSGFVMVANSEIKTEITTRLNSVSNTVSVMVSTNDIIKVMVENTEDDNDITIDTLGVSLNG